MPIVYIDYRSETLRRLKDTFEGNPVVTDADFICDCEAWMEIDHGECSTFIGVCISDQVQ